MKYFEWVAVVVTIIAVILNSFALAPWSNLSGILSGVMWTIIALHWKKNSLLWMQAFFAIVYLAGFIKWLIMT